MIKFLHRYLHWLLSDELKRVGDLENIARSQEDDLKALHSDNTVLLKEIEDTKRKRLTLDDLKLKPNQYALLRGTPGELRQALYDMGEMVCMTELNEDARIAVIKYRNYIMNQTLSPTKNNEIPADKTIVDAINQRHAKFFAPKT